MKRFINGAGLALLITLPFGCSQGSKPSPQTGGVAPCSKAGQEQITVKNKLSRPAGDNLFDVNQEDLKYSLANLGDLKRRPFSDPNTHGDQCRAVLGPLPVISCPETPFIPVTYQGLTMTQVGDKFFADGKPTKWTPADGCDKPGHIGLLFSKFPGNDINESCSPMTRLGGKRIGNVYWTWLCHNWHVNHDEFLTVIGANMETGETCFIGHDVAEDPDPKHHVLAKDVMPPGGIDPTNVHQRAKAAEFWEPGHMFVCLDCHSTNGPFLGTPNARAAVLPNGERELFPRYPDRLRMTPGSGFRVIGTGHNVFATDIPLREIRRPKAIVPMKDDKTADNSCTKCHQLSDQEHYVRLARLSVGLKDTYVKERKDVPWMPHGIDPTDAAEVKLAQVAVARYERAWKDPSWRFSEAELLSECPAPAEVVSTTTKAAIDDKGTSTLTWRYANDLGGVPLRDDVRFQVKIEGSDGSTCQIRDVAPNALGATDWKLEHPTQKGVAYEYKLQPYRYCFDKKPYAFANEAKVGERVERK